MTYPSSLADGDGWNNAFWTWAKLDGATISSPGDVLEMSTGTMPSGSYQDEQVCAAASSCFSMTVGKGNYASEISWELSAGADSTETFSSCDKFTICLAADLSWDSFKTPDGCDDPVVMAGAGSSGSCPVQVTVHMEDSYGESAKCQVGLSLLPRTPPGSGPESDVVESY